MGSFLTAACFAANHPAAQPSPTFSSDVSITPGMAGTGSMPGISVAPSQTQVAESAPPAGPDAVAIDGFAFLPASLGVRVGDTVTWTNRDEDPHTVVAGDGSFRSQVLGSGGTFSFTFPRPGTFDYVCSIHPFMHGTVVVTA
ncbi:cupredoxin family copper-binding protein [Mycobacterium hodleri]|nr:cupredoxin family copper-binding protein [Mycolicibacterium hodleri]